MEYELAPSEAARMLKVTTATLINWEKEKHLTSIRTIGGHRRYKKDEIEQLNRRMEKGKR